MLVALVTFPASGEETGDFNYLLDLSLSKLLQIKVTTASKFEQTAIEAPSLVSVITRREMENMGARNLEDVLRTIVGFDTQQVGYRNNTLYNIRGIQGGEFNNNKIRLMINGHFLQGTFGGAHIYEKFLPLKNISRIEVIRGPGSALYGTNAFIGVINIITLDSWEIKDNNEFSLTAGSFNTTQTSLLLSKQENDWDIVVFGDFYKTDGARELVESDLASQIYGIQASAAPGYTDYRAEVINLHSSITFGDFDLQAFYTKNEVSNPTGISGSLTSTSLNNIKIESYFAELSYQQFVFDNAWELKTKAFYDYYRWNPFFEDFSPGVASFYNDVFANVEPFSQYDENLGIYGVPDAKFSYLGGEVSLSRKFENGIQFLAGIYLEKNKQYDITHIANGNITGVPVTINGVFYLPMQPFLGGFEDITADANWNAERTRNTKALFAQSTFDLKTIFDLNDDSGGLDLTVGVRKDDYDDVGASTNLRLGLVYSVSENLYFKGLYGEAFRVPSFAQLGQTNNPVELGNPELKPEDIKTYELLVGTQFTESSHTTLSYFHSKITDIITRQHSIVFENFGEIISSGLEFETKISFDEEKYLFFNITKIDVENKSHDIITEGELTYQQVDFRPGGVPDLIANLGVNYNFSNDINTNATLNYVSSKKRSEEKIFSDGVVVNLDQRPNLESRILLNTSLQFKNVLPGMDVQISGHNLLNDDHRDPDFVGDIPNDLPRAGRTFQVDLSFRF